MKTLHLILLLLGLWTSFTTIKYIYETKTFLKDGKTVSSIVVENIEIPSDEERTFRPILSFKSQLGVETRFEPNTLQRNTNFIIGERINIVVKKSDIRVKNFFGIYSDAIITFIISSVLLVVSIGYFLFINSVKKMSILPVKLLKEIKD